jgi:hypothetical protein
LGGLAPALSLIGDSGNPRIGHIDPSKCLGAEFWTPVLFVGSAMKLSLRLIVIVL